MNEYDPTDDDDMTVADTTPVLPADQAAALTTAAAAVTVDDHEDATDLDPETFDFHDFLQGMRPIRRRIRIYARADLIADLDRIVQAIHDLEATMLRDDKGRVLDGEEDRVQPQLDTLVEKWTATKTALDRSARWFTIRARSKEWLDRFMDEQRKRADIGLVETTDSDGNTTHVIPTETGRVQHYAELLTHQIVSPKGVTVDGLKALYAINDGEFNRLVGCAIAANSLSVPGSVGRDFSARHSAAHDGASS